MEHSDRCAAGTSVVAYAEVTPHIVAITTRLKITFLPLTLVSQSRTMALATVEV